MKIDKQSELLSTASLNFEETKLTKMTKTAIEPPVKEKRVKKNSLQGRIKAIKKSSSKTLKTALKKVNYPRKSNKRATKAERLELKNRRNHVIMGIGLLLVVVSIAYSTTVVRYFVDSTVSLVALAPQVIFAVIIIFKAFSKLYK